MTVTVTERVVANVEAILDGELAPAAIREIAFLAAVLHDIGAAEALRRHGSVEGRYHELEGPAVARDTLPAHLRCAPNGSH